MKKRMMCLLMAMLMTCSMVISASAATYESAASMGSSYEGKNILSDGTVVENDAIVLRNEDDVREMIEMDGEAYDREYAMKASKIDPQLKRDFETFVSENKNASATTYDEVVSDFIEEYPEYINENIKDDIVTLQSNVTVDLVRDFYIGNGYNIALALFNHSLTAKPAKAYLDMIGNTGGIYNDIRVQLTQKYDFVTQMINFSRKGSSYETNTTKDYVFDKINTDMYWAIHKFEWKRTRTLYNKAYFKIIDIYDFAGGPAIFGVVASMAGTHDFDVEIYGLVQNGVLK